MYNVQSIVNVFHCYTLYIINYTLKLWQDI